jgi:hypothetical protein
MDVHKRTFNISIKPLDQPAELIRPAKPYKDTFIDAALMLKQFHAVLFKNRIVITKKKADRICF